MSRDCRLVEVCLVALACGITRADDPPAPPPEPEPPAPTQAKGPPPAISGATRDDVGTRLHEAQEPRAGLLELGPVTWIEGALEKLNTRLEDAVGLRLGLAYTLTFQAATSGPGDRSGAEGDLDLLAAWRLVGKKDEPDAGTLNINAQNIHPFGEVAPVNLGSEVGSIWETSDGIGESESFPIVQCYYEQWLMDDRMMVVVGKIDTTNYVSTNRYADDRLFFMNRAFSSNPGINYPGNGLGAVVGGKITEEFYLGGCVADANGVESHSGFDSIDEGDFFAAVEGGATLSIGELGEGNYRLTLWHSDAASDVDLPEDYGIAISIDQEVGGGVVPYLKYAWSEGDATGVRHMIAGGIGLEGPFGREDDVLGIGVSWGHPSDVALSDQFVAEAFYRLQLAGSIQCTLGGQLIVNALDRDSGDDEVVGVLEARLRVEF